MGLFDAKDDAEALDQTNPVMTDDEVSSESGELTAGQLKGKRYRESLELIIKYAVDNKAPEAVINAAKTIRPSFFGIAGGGGRGGFAKAEFTADQRRVATLFGVENIDELEEGATCDEMDAFKALKMGRREMHVLSINLIKYPGEKNRVWIDFDADEGVYAVSAIGPDAPEGWTGYLPKEA